MDTSKDSGITLLNSVEFWDTKPTEMKSKSTSSTLILLWNKKSESDKPKKDLSKKIYYGNY